MAYDQLLAIVGNSWLIISRSSVNVEEEGCPLEGITVFPNGYLRGEFQCQGTCAEVVNDHLERETISSRWETSQ